MAVQDLREWIARVDEIGELSRVDGADAATEIGGIVDLCTCRRAIPRCCSTASSAIRPATA